MTRHFTVKGPTPNAHCDMMRLETLESLLDGRAKWPDGTVREIGVPLYERLRAKELARGRT